LNLLPWYECQHNSTCKYSNLYACFAQAKIALENAKKEIILVVNKVDMIKPKTELLEITRKYVSLINGVKLGKDKQEEAALDTTTFMISGLKHDGVDDLKEYLLRNADVKPWTIPAKRGKTSLTNEERVEQIILEAMLDHTHDEIPYIADIHCSKIENYSSSLLKVFVDISVDSSRQQRMCIGQQGRTMIKIRQKSAEYLERILAKRVLVYLNIIVRDEKDNNKTIDQDRNQETQIAS
jgi:GTPase